MIAEIVYGFLWLALFVAGGLSALYLGLLTALSFMSKRENSNTTSTHFAFVVPAHNEESGIAQTVESLRQVDYPADQYEIVVVADNCADKTAQRARDAGARVFERFHDTEKGKGYALDFAFEKLLEEAKADAFVIVDADTLVAENLLSEFAATLSRGELCAQANYRVSNVHASWRTKLMSIAMAAIGGVRGLARERFGLSAVLRGNGMLFSRELLLTHRHEAHGLVEDVEFATDLALHGIRVAFAHETSVYGEMVSGGKAAVSQRKRWEGGRKQLIRQKVPMLLKKGLTKPSLMMLDVAIEILVPPLSTIVVAVGLGFILDVTYSLWVGQPTSGLYFWIFAGVCLGLYVLRGVMISELGFWEGIKSLLFAPFFIVWKLLFARSTSEQQEWVRTEREDEKS